MTSHLCDMSLQRLSECSHAPVLQKADKCLLAQDRLNVLKLFTYVDNAPLLQVPISSCAKSRLFWRWGYPVGHASGKQQMVGPRRCANNGSGGSCQYSSVSGDRVGRTGEAAKAGWAEVGWP